MPPDERVNVGVGAWVLDGSANPHLLMVLRAGAHGADTWSVPGGWIDYGETPEDAAVREVKEETGLDVEPLLLAADRHRWSTGKQVLDGRFCVTLWVPCQTIVRYRPTPTITEPEKCPEVEWVPLGEVRQRRLFAPLADRLEQPWAFGA